MNFRKKNHIDGYAIVSVLMILSVVFVVAVAAVNVISTDSGFSVADEHSKEAFYIAEAGLNAAFTEFKNSNSSGFTHDTNGNSIPTHAYDRLPITLPDTVSAADGWNQWTWNPGSSMKSFTDTGKMEQFRYMVKPVGANGWSITAESTLGDSLTGFKKRVVMAGTIKSAFNYFYFSNSDLSEFVRGDSQTIAGMIFANGNLFIRPSGSTLQISAVRGPGGVVTSPGTLQSAQKIIRNTDAWGRPYGGGTVNIEPANSNTVAPPSVTMTGSSTPEQSFDSNNQLWADPNQGAMKKWGGWVKDGALGVQRQEPPTFKSFDDKGYYYQQAQKGGLLVTSASSGTGISSGVRFYNAAEAREETAVQLDMSKIIYPPNGLIYANTPVRIINASKLKAPVSIVSNSTIYTKGDYNNNNPVSSALMTVARTYHLSDGFNDKDSYKSSIPKASVSSGNTQQINACMVDGPPTVTEINYVKSWNGIRNPLYNPVDQPNGKYCWANSDNLLEDWSGKTLKKRGAIIHINSTTMAKLDNSDAGPGVVAWIMDTHYGVPIRDYAYDSTIVNPPFIPKIIQRTYWAQEK